MRHRPTRLHLLPDHATAAVAEALHSVIVVQNCYSNDALAKLNGKLAQMGIAPISNGGWSRFVTAQRMAGIEPRWRLADTTPTQPGITVSEERYMQLLEAENRQLRAAAK